MEVILMAVKIQTAQGAIEIENDVIATIVGGATTDNYGVVGMASQNPLRDGVNQILNGDNFSKGVVVRQQDGGVTVDVHIIVGYGMKISEISKSVQSRVKNDLNVMLGIVASEVNVTVQGVRMLGD
uniref:Alkaline shock protein n=2 Tax=Weissella TaxID=46255 RepID=G0UHY4_9LACO|nr:alkaline shock protein [Weissella thailandensis fsh4-2]